MSLLSPNKECIYAYDAHHQEREDGIEEDVSETAERERERERERAHLSAILAFHTRSIHPKWVSSCKLAGGGSPTGNQLCKNKKQSCCAGDDRTETHIMYHHHSGAHTHRHW